MHAKLFFYVANLFCQHLPVASINECLTIFHLLLPAFCSTCLHTSEAWTTRPTTVRCHCMSAYNWIDNYSKLEILKISSFFRRTGLNSLLVFVASTVVPSLEYKINLILFQQSKCDAFTDVWKSLLYYNIQVGSPCLPHVWSPCVYADMLTSWFKKTSKTMLNNSIVIGSHSLKLIVLDGKRGAGEKWLFFFIKKHTVCLG